MTARHALRVVNQALLGVTPVWPPHGTYHPQRTTAAVPWPNGAQIVCQTQRRRTGSRAPTPEWKQGRLSLGRNVASGSVLGEPLPITLPTRQAWPCQSTTCYRDTLCMQAVPCMQQHGRCVGPLPLALHAAARPNQGSHNPTHKPFCPLLLVQPSVSAGSGKLQAHLLRIHFSTDQNPDSRVTSAGQRLLGISAWRCP